MPSDSPRTPGQEADDLDADESLEFCVDCLESFRYDDCGGYNPPCECGFHCRSCHDALAASNDNDGFGYPDDDHFPEECSDAV